MKKTLITTLLLASSIILISLGMHEHNTVIAVLGGFFCGIYNSIMNNKDE